MKLELIYQKDESGERYLVKKDGWVKNVFPLEIYKGDEVAALNAAEKYFASLVEICKIKTETKIIKSIEL